MNILIIAPKSVPESGVLSVANGVNFQYLFPLGLAYISAVLKQNRHRVDCINLNHFSGDSGGIIKNKIKSTGYDIVCTGGLSIAYKQIKMVVDAVRVFGKREKIIIGGGIISSEPELMFTALKPDYVVIGEGEKTIVELINCLENNGDIGSINGIGYISEGKFVCNPAQTAIADLDVVPLPDLDGFEFEEYLDHVRPSDQAFYDIYDHPRLYPIICSRSCPFLCTFCYHPLGNKYRQRSVNSVMDEIETNVRRYKINLISIYDELLSNNRQWLYEFCGRMKAFLREIDWECKWLCQMRVDSVDEEMLPIMKESGCYFVSYGFESYNQAVLKSMKKHIQPRDIDRAINITLKHGLSLQANFIFGDRAETLDTAKETLDYWKKRNDAGILMDFIRPYPGSQLYNYCIEKGIIGDRFDFIKNQLFNIVNMTDMSNGDFEKLKFTVHTAELSCRKYILPDRIVPAQDGTCDVYITCPHCGAKLKYGNFLIFSRWNFNLVMHCRSCRRRIFSASRYVIFVSIIMRNLFYLFPMPLSMVIYKLKPKIKPAIKKIIRGAFKKSE